MKVNAKELDYRSINEALRGAEREYTITGCLGQRFICAGMSDIYVTSPATRSARISTAPK